MGKNVLYSGNVTADYDPKYSSPTGSQIGDLDLPLSIDVKINGVSQGAFEQKKEQLYGDDFVTYYGGSVDGPYPVFGDNIVHIQKLSPSNTYWIYIKGNGTYTVEISETDQKEDPEPSTYEPTLRVKDAMTHYVSTLEGVDEPATTIKKLTKQVLDPDGNNEAIQKARTIAQIWEQAAIERGYDPVTAIVGEAVVGTSEI